MFITQKIGDSVTHRIPLRWGNAAFTPGNEWGLIFTAKVNESDADNAAKIQKQTDAGITHSGSTALVEIVPQDTTGENPASWYCDIQAQHLSTGEVRTVWDGRMALKRDITRSTTVSVPIITTEEPVFRGKSAYEVYLDTNPDPVLTEEQWLESLKGEPGEDGEDGAGGAAVIISTTPPDDTTAIWLDPEGWIYSVWNGVDAWVSLQNNPTTSTYFYWNTALFTWQDGESDPTYTFTWEP